MVGHLLINFIKVISITLLLIIYGFLILKQPSLKRNLTVDNPGVNDWLLAISLLHTINCFLTRLKNEVYKLVGVLSTRGGVLVRSRIIVYNSFIWATALSIVLVLFSSCCRFSFVVFRSAQVR
jgi:hypothetical protein